MKVGDLVRMPPPRTGLSGSLGLVTAMSLRHPHDMTQDAYDVTVLGVDGRSHRWYDWQLEMVCEGR